MKVVAIILVTLMLFAVGCDKDDSSNDGPSYYIGNRQSSVYHRPDCSYLPASQNRVTLNSCGDAQAQGYTPCGHCKPCQ